MRYYSALLLLYVIFALLRIGNRTNIGRKTLCFSLLLPAFMLIAFRSYSVGADTFPYYYIYNNMSHYTSIMQPLSVTWMEPGYVLVTYVTSHLGLKYYQFQILVAIFYYISVSRILIKYSYNIGMSCFLFLTMSGMFGMMNQTRMWISITICLYAISYLEGKNLLRFCMIVLLASSFHMSALTFLIAYPVRILIEKNYRKAVWLVLIASVVLMIIGRPLFLWGSDLINRYSKYLSENNERFVLASILNFGVIGTVSWIVFRAERYKLRMICNKNIDHYPQELRDKQAITSSTFAILALGLSIIELSNTIISRCLFFFSFPLLYAFANGLERIRNRKNRIIIKTLVIILFSLKMYIILIFRPNWDLVTNYSFFWNQ